MITALDNIADAPQFGELQEILIVQDEVYFHLKQYETDHFNKHYNSYVIQSTDSYITINHSHLITFVPFHGRNVQGLTSTTQKAIVLKHHLSTV